MQPAVNPRRWTALAVIALAQFMVIMDTSIIGVALPEIHADLGFTPEDLSWVFNAYVIAFGGLLLLGGRLSDLFGAKRLFSRRLGRARRRLAGRRPRRLHRRGDRRARRPRRRRRAHRALRADAADDALRPQPEGAHEGVRPLRRGRPRRRHRRRVPRRRDHRVGLTGRGSSTSTSRSPLVALAADPAADAGRARAARLGRPRRRAHRHRRPRALPSSASSARPRQGWGSTATLAVGAGGLALLALFVAVQAARREPLMRLGILRAPEPRGRQPRAVPARRRLDPDVVLPEPLPAAGARPRRLRGRRRAAADDRHDHARHGRRRPARHGPLRRQADGRRRTAGARRRAGAAVARARRRHLRRRRAAGLAGRRRRDGARVHPSLRHRHLQRARPRKAAWPPASSTPATRSAPRSAWRR